MKVRRYLFIFAGIVALAVVIYFLLFNQAPTTQVTVKVTKGSFPIEVTTTGELIAKHSEKILGPDGLRQIQIYQVKIVEIIPDGSIVDSGQFVATLDRSEISNKIKDEETNLEKFESQMIKTKLDTSLTLRGARDELADHGVGRGAKLRGRGNAPPIAFQVDPQQPRLGAGTTLSRLRHYVNLRLTQPRLKKMLDAFSFGPMGLAIENAHTTTTMLPR